MIKIDNLKRAYDDFLAVDDVSFAIAKGEIAGLLGHNGAGKTTIMKMISGYLQPGAEITALRGPDFALEKTGQQWRVSAGDGEAVAEEIDSLTAALASLRVREAAEITPVQIEYELAVSAADSNLTYRFFTADDDHYVQRDDYAQAFRINEFDYEAIVAKSATQLVTIKPAGDQNSKTDANGESDSESVETSKTGAEVMRNENS